MKIDREKAKTLVVIVPPIGSGPILQYFGLDDISDADVDDIIRRLQSVLRYRADHGEHVE